jgi:hypothetical protein
MLNRLACLLTTAVALAAIHPASADIKLPSIIAEGMVLQQSMAAPVPSDEASHAK